MQQVWVLTSGDHESYRIVGVFSTEALARRAFQVNRDHDVNDPEVMQLDPPKLLTADPAWEIGPQWEAFVYKQKSGWNPGIDHQRDRLRHPTECEVEEISDGFRVRSPISAGHAQQLADQLCHRWTQQQEKEHA